MAGFTGTSAQAYISVARNGTTLDSDGIAIGIDSTNANFIVRENKSLVFYTNDLERLRIPANAGGIQFPATQSASSNANTLDDYEEGTWTPVLRGSSTAGTYVYDTARTGGQYIKIGRQVMIRGVVCVSSITSAGTGDAQITGAPFASTNPAGSWVRTPGNLLCQGGTTALATTGIFCGFDTTGATFFSLYTQSTTNITGIPVTTVDDVNSIWSFTYIYLTDN
jgi:hypothetical protein